jgi:transposase InsO family protein
LGGKEATMSERTRDGQAAGGGGERSEPEPAAAGAAEVRAALPPAGTPAVSYTPAEKAAALVAFAGSGVGMRVFCARQGLSTATLCAWRRAYERDGLAGLAPRANPRNRTGRTRRAYTPEERRAAVEAYRRGGLSRRAFCALWGLSEATLGKWLKVYRARGPKGLEAPFTTPGKRRGRKKRPVASSVREEIVATKRRFPDWGLRRIRDVLARFRGVGVGVHKIREVVREEGLQTPRPVKRRRAQNRVRRFERSRPGELWQSDITSYVLARHRQRVYLTVFLDDHSRYVVSWALAVHQRTELVTEPLLEAIARFGKPTEVLTDQGRQYFAWRGKSRFQRLLLREGIQHVVSRAHHPQTLGKCERLWQSVGRELFERARPQDLGEARRRLGHYFAHYNHFRPHQGIGGVVPADRFFGAESQARGAIEAALTRSEIDLAVGEPPRRPVFLYGQVGEGQLSVHGERGQLVIQTPDGARQVIGIDALGAPARSEEQEHDEEHDRDRDAVRETHQDQGPTQEAHALQAGAAPAGAGPGAVGGGEQRGSRAGAPADELDARVLARQGDQGGGGHRARGDAAAGMADEPERARRYGLRPAEAAAPARQGGECADRSGRGPQGAEEEDRQARARARGGQGPDRSLEDAAGQPEPRDHGQAEGLPRVARTAPPGTSEEAHPGAGREEEPEGSTPWWQLWWERVNDVDPDAGSRS